MEEECKDNDLITEPIPKLKISSPNLESEIVN